MPPSLQLRKLTSADLPFADSLRVLAGWNQTLEDWRRFLAMEPEGCFLAEWDGRPVGTATTLCYGTEMAWIGMVLVHPDERRRGIGKALLRHCIAWLQERRVTCIKLDATPAGKRVYDALGFRDEWTLHRWEHSEPRVPAPADDRLRSWCEDDAMRIRALDGVAFGVPRESLVRALAGQSRMGVVFEPSRGQMGGYGFIRPGESASYLGPIVAESVEAGRSIVQALLAAATGGSVYWDIPDANTAAVDCAIRQGFARQRSLTRMFLGENRCPGDPRQQFGLSGPEVG